MDITLNLQSIAPDPPQALFKATQKARELQLTVFPDPPD
jgi:hypothetical protein